MTWVLHDGAKMCLEHQEQDLPKRFTEACEKDQTGRVSGHCVTKQLPVFLLTHSRRGGGVRKTHALVKQELMIHMLAFSL